MVWPRRIHYPRLIYHVVNRGNNRQVVFLEEDDYRRYLSLLYHYKKKYGFRLFAFCLMTNHVHLLLQVGQVSVSKIMQSLTIAHTKHYQHKYRCCGHVWQGRFRSPVVSDDEYFLNSMIYIEQNPLRAGMVKRVEEYRWSSYRLNLRRKPSILVDRDVNPVWQRVQESGKNWATEYRRLTGERLAERQRKRIHEATRGNGHYMTEKFQKQMEELLPRKRKRGRPRQSEQSNAIELSR